MPGNNIDKLQVYGRRDCHLCTEMIKGLEQLRSSLHFDIEIIDIDSDRQLVDQYGLRIPVLVAHGKELCFYHLDEQAVRQYLGAVA